MRGANTRYTRVRSWPRLEPQLEKPVATDSVALTDNNFVCALSSFRRRQAIQLPICRAWWTSFIQPSTVSPCLPVPKFLCPCCLFPFVSYGKYFHVNSTFFFQSFLSSGMELEIIAASWRNETTSETLKKKKSEESSQKERSNIFFLLFPITSRIYCLQLLNTLHNRVTSSGCKSLSKKATFRYTHPPKSYRNLIKKKRETSNYPKSCQRLALSPLSSKLSRSFARGRHRSFQPRLAPPKKKRNSSEIPKKRIGNSFLLHDHLRHLATNLSLSLSSLLLSTIHGQMIAVHSLPESWNTFTVLTVGRGSTPQVINRRNSDRKQRGIH